MDNSNFKVSVTSVSQIQMVMVVLYKMQLSVKVLVWVLSVQVVAATGRIFMATYKLRTD